MIGRRNLKSRIVRTTSTRTAGYPAKTRSDAESMLVQGAPAWFLGVDGRVIAGNLLAIWLWGGVQKRQVRSDVIIGRHAFEIYQRHRRRIPFDINPSFVQAKLLAASRLGEDFPSPLLTKFVNDLRSTSDNSALLSGTPEQRARKEEDSYALRMIPPAGSYGIDLLEFSVNVYEVRLKALWLGFVALYEPIGDTVEFIRNKREYIDTNYGTISPYVVGYKPPKGGDVRVQERITSDPVESDPRGQAFAEAWDRWERRELRCPGYVPEIPKTIEEKRHALETLLNSWNRWERRPDVIVDRAEVEQAVASMRDAKAAAASVRSARNRHGSATQSTGTRATAPSSR
jgi:hypothetical protein